MRRVQILELTRGIPGPSINLLTVIVGKPAALQGSIGTGGIIMLETCLK